MSIWIRRAMFLGWIPFGTVLCTHEWAILRQILRRITGDTSDVPFSDVLAFGVAICTWAVVGYSINEIQVKKETK